jgi:hypothetical protein
MVDQMLLKTFGPDIMLGRCRRKAKALLPCEHPKSRRRIFYMPNPALPQTRSTQVIESAISYLE